MASSSCSLELAGGGSKAAIFGRCLAAKARHQIPSVQIIPASRRRPTVATALGFQQKGVTTAKCDSLNSLSWRQRGRGDRITPQKLDDWMRDSVGEILRNIGKAPFLMRIFSDESESKPIGSKSSGLMIEKEDATAENWLGIKKRWEEESSVPDGVILVEELDSDGGDGEAAASGEEGDCRSNVKWGILVQGRGMDCSACYILDTSKVQSSMGFCTHFCLVRAKCFGDPVGVQLKNVWLQPER